MSIKKFAWVSATAALLVAGVMATGAVLDQTVDITEAGFVPARVDVAVGQKVIFRNTTSKNQGVTTAKPAGSSEQDRNKTGFDSGVITPATSWEVTFSEEGTYTYYSREDRSRTGTIVVNSGK